MRIKLENVSKRYRREWILKQINLDLLPSGRYAVSGPNGAGKSTFLKMLSGHLTPSRGCIDFILNDQTIPVTDVYQSLSFAAPYIELIEEFTLEEAISFHQGFRPLLGDMDVDDLIGLLGMEKVRRLAIGRFSSGMKQRLKLVLACCSTADYILLDEPTTNLDQQGIEWYHHLLEEYLNDRLLVVASNVPDDYRICTELIDIKEFKR